MECVERTQKRSVAVKQRSDFCKFQSAQAQNLMRASVNFKVYNASLKACGGKFVRVSYAELTEGDGFYAAVFLSRSLIRQLFVHVVDAAAAVHIETEILRAGSQGKELRLFARFALGTA